MCYGFDYEVQQSLGAYIDKNHIWHEHPLCFPDEVIKLTLAKIQDSNHPGVD